MYFCPQMEIRTLHNLLCGLHKLFNDFLTEHGWVRAEREMDRMGYRKRKNLRTTIDLLRLIIGTFYIIKKYGTKKDFHDLMKRLYVFFLKIYELPNEKLRKMIDNEVKERKPKVNSERK